ncbi:MAG: family 20 glycosylhydrolase [Bacteroidia bacterium]
MNTGLLTRGLQQLKNVLQLSGMKSKARTFGIFFQIVFLIIVFNCVNAQIPVSIIPKPVSLVADSGFFILDSKTKIIAASEEYKSCAELFNQYLLKNFGFALQILKSLPKGNNYIVFRKVDSDIDSKEYYNFTVSENRIEIFAENNAGIFYGLQSIQQMILQDEKKSLKIPCSKVEDYPQFSWRGMHLDVGRHFFNKKEIKQYIDYLARYKMNVFHWHLTEDQGWRIEIKSYPELTNIGAWRNGSMIGAYSEQKFDTIRYGGFYTQNDIREIVEYAKQRFVTIVPEIEMPGHCMAALAANPHLSCTGGPFEVGKIWGVYEDVYCTKEETFKFLEEVLAEVCELFPGKYIHIGGDEAPKTRWKNCTHCQRMIDSLKLKDEHGLQSYFISRIEKFLNLKGKQIIGWDEIIEGGLAPNAAVMSWRGAEGGIAAAKQKHFVVMSPGDYCYFDHYQSANNGEPLAFGGYTPLEKVYHYEIVPEELNAEEKKYIIGAQANVWTEYITNFSQVEYMIFPRMCALAEVLWTPEPERSFNWFLNRLKYHFNYFEKNHIDYSKAIYDIKADILQDDNNKGVNIKLSTWMDSVQIYYSINDSQLTCMSPIYLMPIHVDSSAVFKAAAYMDCEMKSKEFEQEINFSKATGRKIILLEQPSVKYNYGGEFSLVNGVTGSLPWRGADWLGFSGNNMEAIIDFEEEENISSVTIDVLEDNVSWVHLPKSAEVFSSNDGINFTPVKKVTTEEINQMKRKLILSTGEIKTRFIKVIAENAGAIPEGFAGAGNPAWLFVDEIGVE